MSQTTIGVIPARGGSKGIEQKNITELAGKPLIAHTIKAAREADCLSTTIVSTDDDEIASTAESWGARVPFRRPDHLATDMARTEPVIEHALTTLQEAGERYDDFVLLQPTSPLRTATNIQEAYELYQQSGADSLISAYPTKETRWQLTVDGAQQLNFTDASKRRQDRDPEYVSNGAIYITGVDQLLQTATIDSGYTEIYPMNEVISVDVDTPFDLWLTEKILNEWVDPHSDTQP